MNFSLNVLRFKTLLFTIVLVSTYVASEAQNDDIPTNTIHSPEVSAMGKYFDIPVTYYTGQPNVSIPLYTLQASVVSVPISLSYHPAGIKVAEEASQVGLGWNLNCGGSITQQVRDVNDFASQRGWLDNAPNYMPDQNDVPSDYFFDGLFFATPELQIQELFFNVNGVNKSLESNLNIQSPNGYDYEPDLFYLNLNGRALKFYFSDEGEIVIHSGEKVKIAHNGITGTGSAWEVIDEQGVKYHFQETQRTLKDPSNPGGIPIEYISTWFLTSIETPYNEEIEFTYDRTLDKIYPAPTYSMSRTVFTTFGGLGPLQGNVQISPYFGVYVNSVSLKKNNQMVNKVNFQGSYNRPDIQDAKQIDQIQVFNRDNKLLKTFNFEYGFFDGQGGNSGFGTTSSAESAAIGWLESVGVTDVPSRLRKRLKLEAVIDSAFNIERKYEFDYFSGLLPNKLTYSKDHWGYYNGRANSEPFHKEIIQVIPFNLPIENKEVPGGNRNADETAANTKIGSLKSIKYPTGGSTEFEFESNTYLDDRDTGGLVKKSGSFGIGDYQPYPVSKSADTFQIVSENSINLFNLSAFLIAFDPDEFDSYAPPFELKLTISQIDGSFSKVYPVMSLDDQDEFSDELQLAPGTYRITADANPNNGNPEVLTKVKFSIDYNWFEKESTELQYGGGLRVSSISHKDENGVERLNQKFIYPSTGTIMSYPHYFTENITINRSQNNQTTNEELDFDLIQTSTSNLPLANSGGVYVGYDSVAVVNYSASDNGSNTYFYHNTRPTIEYDPIITSNPPLASINKNGLLTKQLTRDNANVLLREENITYTSLFGPVVSGLLRKFGVSGCDDGRILNCVPYTLRMQQYTLSPSNIVIATKEVLNYDGEDQATRTFETYTYGDNHQLPITTTSIVSGGEKILTENYYVSDFENSDAVYIDSMKNANMLHQPIEILQYKLNADDTNKRLLSGKVYEYSNQSGKIGLIDKVYSSKIASPVSVYVPLKTIFNINGLIYENTGQVVYDNNANVVETLTTSGSPVAFYWGYDKHFPVAKFDNLSVTDLNANTTLTGYLDQLDAYNTLNSNADRSTLKTLNDNIRNSVAGDVMIYTYTYDPLVGLTSQTDPNGITVYYEYDDLNRLKLIRDHEDNIIQHYEYHYHNESQGGAQ